MNSCAQNDIYDLTSYPLENVEWREQMRDKLDKDGALKLPNFLTTEALLALDCEASDGLGRAWFDPREHNIYLDEGDSEYPHHHIRNRLFKSSKGCITDDQISCTSSLKRLYHNSTFREAIAFILCERNLYEYTDSLASINIHYAREGEGLNWHFDNSSFAITLMISPANLGGLFEYVRDVRDADNGDMGFDLATQIVDGDIVATKISLCAGDLLLFRGRNSLHRVTPVIDSESVRKLATLAYNNSPGIALSENARLTFFGRLGVIKSES